MIKGVSCIKGNVSFKECMQCSVRCIPPFLVSMFIDSQRDYFERHPQYSVSQIVGCLRRTVLQIKEDWFIKPDMLMAAIKGILIHRGLAEYFKTKQGYLVEYKMDKQIGPYLLTGTLDLYSYRTKTIYDFKTGKTVRPWYKQQLNIYAEMINEPVDKLVIVLVEDKFKSVVIDREPIDILERLSILDSSIKNNTLPKQELSEMCNHCEVKELCMPKIVVGQKT